MSIKENLSEIKKQIPDNVTLVAVSKTKPVEAILEAYKCGQLCFGENKVQEMVPKYEALPKDIQWHFIGHLQSNKVKYMAPFVHTIHSVDSSKLLKEINKQALANNRKINVLLQVHISAEETKFGLSEKETVDLLKSGLLEESSGVQVAGVMGMATNTSDENKVIREFKWLKDFFDYLKKGFFSNKHYFKEISMGMSGDYLLGIAQGSTMVRIGSSIFGERNYH